MNDQTIEAEPTTGPALIVIPAASLPTLVEADKSDIIGRLRAELAGYIPDASTEDGRAEIGTKARKVGVAKADFIRLAMGLKADHQATIKNINTELKLIEDDCDAIRDGILAPRTEYLNRQKAIVTANEAQIAALEVLTDGLDDLSSADIKARYQSINSEFEWAPEFIQRASRVQNGVVAQLQVAHQAAKEREVETAAEAVRQAEETERQRLAAIGAQKAHEAAIAAEATRLAEIEAEQRRQKDAEAAQALLDAAAERERLAEERAARMADQAETTRRAVHRAALDVMARLAAPKTANEAVIMVDTDLATLATTYDREWEEFKDDAKEVHECVGTALMQRHAYAKAREAQGEVDRKEAQRVRDEAARLAQEETAAATLKAAMDAERQRVADEKAAEAQALADRMKRRKHVEKINRELLDDIISALSSDGEMSVQLAEDIGKVIVESMQNGALRHVGPIQY